MKNKLRKGLKLSVTLCFLFLLTIGANDCKEEDQLVITQVALQTVEIGSIWINVKIESKCTAGEWSEEDCEIWKKDWPKVTEVVTDILPWAISKLMETTTEEERENLVPESVVESFINKLEHRTVNYEN